MARDSFWRSRDSVRFRTAGELGRELSVESFRPVQSHPRRRAPGHGSFRAGRGSVSGFHYPQRRIQRAVMWHGRFRLSISWKHALRTTDGRKPCPTFNLLPRGLAWTPRRLRLRRRRWPPPFFGSDNRPDSGRRPPRFRLPIRCRGRGEWPRRPASA